MLVSMAFAASPTIATADLIDGLVEYWELDGDYSAGIDESHVGTLQAKGTGLAESGFVAAKFGEGIDLESSDANNQASVVIGGDENDFDFTDASMSVSLWYTTESLYRDWQTLIGKGENGAWRLARNSTTPTRIKLSLSIIGEGKLDQQDGSWHHVVATMDAIEGNRIFVDGEEVASTTTPAPPKDTPVPMQIGGNPQAADRGWDGILDDVGIWNRPLTDEEVASLWNDGTGASIASLIGAAPASFRITEIDYSAGDTQLTLTWDSKPGETYAVKYSPDMTNWDADLDDGIEADAGETTSASFDLSVAGIGEAGRLFFRIEKQ